MAELIPIKASQLPLDNSLSAGEVIFAKGDELYRVDLLKIIEENGSSSSTGQDGLISGASEHISGYTFRFIATKYRINGTLFDTPLSTEITFDPADPVLDRIDLVVIELVDSIPQIKVIKGTPGNPATKPLLTDIERQIEFTFVTVNAGTTEPANIENIIAYDENLQQAGGEFDTSVIGTGIFLEDTSEPYSGTKAILFEDVSLVNSVTFTSGTTIQTSGYNLLIKVNIISRGSIVGFNVNIGGNSISVTNGNYGFNAYDTTGYQTIIIPLSVFSETSFNNIVISARTSSGRGSSDFLMDRIVLQKGVYTPEIGDFTPTGGYSGTAQDLKNEIDNFQIPDIDQVLQAGDIATRSVAFWDPDTQNAIMIGLGQIIFSLGGANYTIRQEDGSSQDHTFLLPSKAGDLSQTYVLATTDDVPNSSNLISTDTDNVLAEGSDGKLFVPQADSVTEANVRTAGAVMTTGAQTIQDVKTFSASPIVPTPTQDFEAATKEYVDQATPAKTTQTITSGGNYNNLEITGDVVIFENENAQAIINGIRGKKDFLIVNNSTQYDIRINNEASVTGTAKNITLPTTTPALIGVGGTARIVENEINYTLVDVFASKYRPEFRELVGVNVQTVDENSVGGTMPTKQIETYRDTQSTAMSKADLNSAYPDAKRPFNVVCRGINRIYKKVDDINNDWISIITTAVT